MVGFILIVIIVSVLMLVFLGYFLTKPQETLESYEAESFIQAFLPYTTDCRDNIEFVSIQRLIFKCAERFVCLDGRFICDVLETTLEGIIAKSWEIEKGKIKGYDFQILINKAEMVVLKQGNETGSSRTAFQDFTRGGNSIEILFTIYG